MLYRPTNLPQKARHLENQAKATPDTSVQHGLHQENDDKNLLLDIPVEILTRITSDLDPHVLFSLSLVRKSLHEHVENDNTWRHAFLAQYLGVGPEGDVEDSSQHIMLRRFCTTWKMEYIVRDELIRIWARSPVGSVLHNPLHSPISRMLLMENNALLCSSIQYGVISRSFPLNGKVLPGFLDAAGSANGRGIGNPNAEFTPNVSSCAFVADGGTARILWGHRTGLVSFMTTTRTMESTRRAITDFRTCELGDQHDASVTDTLWLGSTNVAFAVSASEDGRVKLWDPQTASCLWASEQTLRIMVPEPCMKLAASFNAGTTIAAVMRNGEIRVWWGFNFRNDGGSLRPEFTSTVPCPFVPEDSTNTPKPIALHLNDSSLTPSILVAFQDDDCFHRLDIRNDGSHTLVSFGEPSMGAVSSISPYFSNDPAMGDLVLAGDRLGCVSVYNWNSEPSTTPISPIHKFEAYRDGSAITSVAWNGAILVTGSSRGSTHIFDGISFERLKKIGSPVPPFPRRGAAAMATPDRDTVHHILLGPNRDTVFVGVGDRVLAWKPAPITRTPKGGVRGRKAGGSPLKKKHSGSAKWSRQLEMKHEISEIKGILQQEANRSSMRQGKHHEQRARLNELGLSEAEALEYVLMMSRDEATSSAVPEATPADNNLALTEGELSAALAEGVFETDDGAFQLVEGRSMSGFTSTSTSSSPPSRESRGPSPTGRPILRLAASPSNSRIQISPRHVPEPMEAGNGETPSIIPPRELVHLGDEGHFPVFGSPSPPSSLGSPVGSLPASRSNSKSSLLGKQRSPVKSAWSKPLPVPVPGPSASAASQAGTRTSPTYGRGGLGGTSRSLYQSNDPMEDMDDDLRYALELSLAEAHSRGDGL